MTRERPDVAAVGLTGGIGAGKSTALRFFGEAGASRCPPTRSCTSSTRARRSSGLWPSTSVVQVLAVGGEVDRRSLAEAVRGRPDSWPGSRPSLIRWWARRSRGSSGRRRPGSVVVCEVPLLFEAGMQDLFDLVVTIEARADVRRERSVHAFDLELFGEFEALQASSERRVAEADLAFFNDGDMPSTCGAFVRCRMRQGAVRLREAGRMPPRTRRR